MSALTCLGNESADTLREYVIASMGDYIRQASQYLEHGAMRVGESVSEAAALRETLVKAEKAYLAAGGK